MDEPVTKAPNKRKRPRPWSALEQALFEEGLELYGRDWKQVLLGASVVVCNSTDKLITPWP